MADGLTTQSSTLATIPTSTIIATDDASSAGHVQIVKLAVSTDGSATALTADNTDGLLVKVTNHPTFEPARAVAQTQASSGLTTASTAYSVDDVVGAGWVFTSMGGEGIIRGYSLVDKAGVATGGVALHFFSGAVTFGTDNAAPSLSTADAAKHLFSYSVSGPIIDLGTGLINFNNEYLTRYVCDSTSLYVYGTLNTSVSGGFYSATTDLPLKLIYEPGT